MLGLVSVQVTNPGQARLGGVKVSPDRFCLWV